MGMVVTLGVQILHLGYPSGDPLLQVIRTLAICIRVYELHSHSSPHNQTQDPWGELRHSQRGSLLNLWISPLQWTGSQESL